MLHRELRRGRKHTCKFSSLTKSSIPKRFFILLLLSESLIRVFSFKIGLILKISLWSRTSVRRFWSAGRPGRDATRAMPPRRSAGVLNLSGKMRHIDTDTKMDTGEENPHPFCCTPHRAFCAFIHIRSFKTDLPSSYAYSCPPSCLLLFPSSPCMSMSQKVR